MSLVKDIYDILKDLKKWILKGQFSANRSELFEKYIQQPYEKLVDVHKDYVLIFGTLSERLGREGLNDATIEWFRKARAKEQVYRSELRNCLDDSGGFVDGLRFTWHQSNRDDVRIAAENFAHSIYEYFGGNRRRSRSQRLLGVFDVLKTLTRTSEEVAAWKLPKLRGLQFIGGMLSEPVKSIDNYINKMKTIEHKRLVNDAKKRLSVRRVLDACGIDQSSMDEDAINEVLMNRINKSFAELERLPDNDVDRILLKLQMEEGPQLAKDAKAVLEGVNDTSPIVGQLIARLDDDDRDKWEELISSRDALAKSFGSNGYFSVRLKAFVDSQLATLEDRMDEVQRELQNAKTAFGVT